jgi:hypothetical protein
MFQITFVEKIKIHILSSRTYFFFENLAVYDTMSKNVVEWVHERKHTPAPVHTHTHTHTHTHERTRMHSPMHT